MSATEQQICGIGGHHWWPWPYLCMFPLYNRMPPESDDDCVQSKFWQQVDGILITSPMVTGGHQRCHREVVRWLPHIRLSEVQPFIKWTFVQHHLITSSPETHTISCSTNRIMVLWSEDISFQKSINMDISILPWEYTYFHILRR